MGVISGNTKADLVNSFFDVFTEITVTPVNDAPVLTRNLLPARLSANSGKFLELETAYDGPPAPLPLVDPKGLLFGQLARFKLVIAQPSHAIIKREIIELDRKVNLLLQQQPGI